MAYFGRLLDNKAESRGERFLQGAPGIYLHKDSTKAKVDHYCRVVQLETDGLFYAVKWEVRANRLEHVKVPRATDEWAQRAHGLRSVALLVCSRTYCQGD